MRLIFLDLNLQGLCKVFLALSFTDKFPRTLAPLLPHAHIIPPDTRHLRLQIRRGGKTEAWWSWSWRDPPPPGSGPPLPALALAPGLAQISGDPAWLTQGTLPPPLPLYLTLPRHWHQSSVQIFGSVRSSGCHSVCTSVRPAQVCLKHWIFIFLS